MRNFNFRFEVTCAGDGSADLDRVEDLIDLSLKELLMDEMFIEALDEKEAVTIQVTRLDK